MIQRVMLKWHMRLYSAVVWQNAVSPNFWKMGFLHFRGFWSIAHLIEIISKPTLPKFLIYRWLAFQFFHKMNDFCLTKHSKSSCNQRWTYAVLSDISVDIRFSVRILQGLALFCQIENSIRHQQDVILIAIMWGMRNDNAVNPFIPSQRKSNASGEFWENCFTRSIIESWHERFKAYFKIQTPRCSVHFFYKKLENPYWPKSFFSFAHFLIKKFLASFLFLVKIKKMMPKLLKVCQKYNKYAQKVSYKLRWSLKSFLFFGRFFPRRDTVSYKVVSYKKVYETGKFHFAFVLCSKLSRSSCAATSSFDANLIRMPISHHDGPRGLNSQKKGHCGKIWSILSIRNNWNVRLSGALFL